MSEERRHILRREVDKNGCPYLTAEQMEEIAEKAAQKTLDKVALDVGRNVISKVFWVAGAAAVAVYLWLKDKGGL